MGKTQKKSVRKKTKTDVRKKIKKKLSSLSKKQNRQKKYWLNKSVYEFNRN